MARGGELVRGGEVRRGRRWNGGERGRITRKQARWYRAVRRGSRRSQVDVRVGAGKFIQTGS